MRVKAYWQITLIGRASKRLLACRTFRGRKSSSDSSARGAAELEARASRPLGKEAAGRTLAPPANTSKGPSRKARDPFVNCRDVPVPPRSHKLPGQFALWAWLRTSDLGLP